MRHPADTGTYEHYLRLADRYRTEGLKEMEKNARDKAQKALKAGRRDAK